METDQDYRRDNFPVMCDRGCHSSEVGIGLGVEVGGGVEGAKVEVGPSDMSSVPFVGCNKGSR